MPSPWCHDRGQVQYSPSTSQSPPVLSAPYLIKKEKRGAQKESAVNNLGNPTSKTDCSLNNEQNLLLRRITVFSARDLPSKKGNGMGENRLDSPKCYNGLRTAIPAVEIEANIYEN